jgi:hypothetical protein
MNFSEKFRLEFRTEGMPIIPALRRLRQEDHKLEANLHDIVSSRLAWAK